jgi:general nucleoside transport system permease protein
MNTFTTIFALGVTLAVPILWAALGEVIFEQSGVLNIGVEGVMVLGAFGAAMGYRYAGNDLYVGLLCGIAAGVVAGVVLSIVYVRLGMDQIVAGIMVNVFVIGLTAALYGKYLGGGVAGTLHKIDVPLLSRIPYVGRILFQHDFLVYAAVLVAPIVWYLMRRTWFGLYARAASEMPRAVESSGVNVLRIRYVAVMLGSILTAVGGAALVLSTSAGFVPGLTSGRGFIALAVVVLAGWNPFWVVLCCLLFGVTQALQFQIQNLGFLSHVPSDFVLALPYAVTIVAVVFARASRYPAACGVPYRPAGAVRV